MSSVDDAMQLLTSVRSCVLAWQQMVSAAPSNHSPISSGPPLRSRSESSPRRNDDSPQRAAAKDSVPEATADSAVAELRVALERSHKDVRSLTSELTEAKSFIDTLKARSASYATQLDDLKRKIHSANEGRVADRAMVNECTERATRMQKEVASWKIDLASYKNAASAVCSEVASLRADVSRLSASCSHLTSQRALLQTDLHSARSEVELLKGQLHERDVSLAACNEEISRQTAQWNSIGMQCQTAETEEVAKIVEAATSAVNRAAQLEQELLRSTATLEAVQKELKWEILNPPEGLQFTSVSSAPQMSAAQNDDEQAQFVQRLATAESKVVELELLLCQERAVAANASAIFEAQYEKSVSDADAVVQLQKRLAEVEPAAAALATANSNLEAACDSMQSKLRSATCEIDKLFAERHKSSQYSKQLEIEVELLHHKIACLAQQQQQQRHRDDDGAAAPSKRRRIAGPRESGAEMLAHVAAKASVHHRCAICSNALDLHSFTRCSKCGVHCHIECTSNPSQSTAAKHMCLHCAPRTVPTAAAAAVPSVAPRRSRVLNV